MGGGGGGGERRVSATRPRARPLRASAGGATPHDRALLGLSKAQYAAVAAAFSAVDEGGRGVLQKSQMYHVFERAQVGGSLTDTAQEYAQFCDRMDEYLDPDGGVRFKVFLVLWTGNA